MARIISITNALTDILIPVNDSELTTLGITKGASTSIRKIDLNQVNKLLNERQIKTFPAGSPTNTIRGLRNLGFNCALIGAVGQDKTGEEFIQRISQEGIEYFFNKNKEKQSGKCFVFITPDGERSFTTDLGACTDYGIDYPLGLKESDLFHTSGYELVSNPKKMLYFANLLKRLKAQISFDLASKKMIEHCPEDFEKMLEYADVIFATEEERDTLPTGLERKLKRDKTLVLKKGKKGSVIYYQQQIIPVQIKEAQRLVNTNGAGDSYACGFLAEYIQGKNLKECGNFASLIASKVCSQEESWYKGN